MGTCRMFMGRGRLCAAASGMGLALLATSALCSLWLQAAHADTLEQALVQTYQNNPQLNAQRAAARAVDESVAIALGGYRPRVTATGSLNEVYLDTLVKPGLPANRTTGENVVSALGATATQTLFNGFQTSNRTRQA